MYAYIYVYIDIYIYIYPLSPAIARKIVCTSLWRESKKEKRELHRKGNERQISRHNQRHICRHKQQKGQKN